MSTLWVSHQLSILLEYAAIVISVHRQISIPMELIVFSLNWCFQIRSSLVFFSQDGVGEGSTRDEQDEAVEGQERAVPGRRQEGPHLHHGAQASEQQGQERQPGGRGKQVRIPDHSKISVKDNFQWGGRLIGSWIKETKLRGQWTSELRIIILNSL